ncbi:MAG: Na+/H+ antiporter NhaA [Leptonema sp. (in: bacteria)]
MNPNSKNLHFAFLNFFRYESSSGILLFFLTILAFVISNSKGNPYYQSFLEYKFKIGFENFYLEKSLLLWINDALMSFFFFLVGLEIKREILVGELKDFKKATLPIGAALGGMILPAVLFLILHGDRPGKEGWGIPMATDIAFSLSILKLLGDQVPITSRIFLTAFAIIDDLGAILIIAFFYSSSINYLSLGFAFFVILLLAFINYLDIRNLSIYLILGVLLWILFLKSGIHPTIAAVILAFAIPAKPKGDIAYFLDKLEKTKEELKKNIEPKNQILLKDEQIETIEELNQSLRSIQSPLQKLENQFHGFVAFFVMPIFAFANAGVEVSTESFSILSFNIASSLVLGKLIGILLGVYICTKLFKINLPENNNWMHYFGLAFLGGVGFTMSLFINNLAYTEIKLIEEAKIGILIGSMISGISGYAILKISQRKKY